MGNNVKSKYIDISLPGINIKLVHYNSQVLHTLFSLFSLSSLSLSLFFFHQCNACPRTNYIYIRFWGQRFSTINNNTTYNTYSTVIFHLSSIIIQSIIYISHSPINVSNQNVSQINSSSSSTTTTTILLNQFLLYLLQNKPTTESY